MDARIEAVLAEYEAREKEETVLLRHRAPGDPAPNVDDMLIPIGHDVGVLLNLLIKTHKAKTILEVGASYGNSAIWLAEAARETGGKVISLEVSEKKVDFARKMAAKAGLGDNVEFMVGDALESIESLPGPFDFVLIDLWKELYIPCIEAVYPKLAEGALIAADNMLSPPIHVPEAVKYRQVVRAKANIQSVLLDIGQGVELSRFSRAF